MKRKTFAWIVFAFLALTVGVYPLIYYIIDMHDKGLMGGKTTAAIGIVVITFGKLGLEVGVECIQPVLGGLVSY
jgi:hypothetical protein